MDFEEAKKIVRSKEREEKDLVAALVVIGQKKKLEVELQEKMLRDEKRAVEDKIRKNINARRSGLYLQCQKCKKFVEVSSDWLTADNIHKFVIDCPFCKSFSFGFMNCSGGDSFIEKFCPR